MDNTLKIEKMFKDTFSSPVGQDCLKYLKGIYVDRQIYRPGLTFDEVAFREGQANIVRQILREVEK